MRNNGPLKWGYSHLTWIVSRVRTFYPEKVSYVTLENLVGIETP